MSCHISVLVWCVLMPPRTTKTEWDRRRRRCWRQPSHFHCRLFAALNRNKQLNDESRPDFWLHSIPPRLKLIACLCDATIGTFQFVHCWSRPLKECEVDVNHPFICFTYYILIFILEKNISEFKSARYQLFRWEQKLFVRCPAHKSALLGSSTDRIRGVWLNRRNDERAQPQLWSDEEKIKYFKIHTSRCVWEKFE